jgi:ATP synthase protein I
MKKETRKLLRQVGLASTVGFSVAFAVVIGGALGYWLSGLFGMPFLLPLFFLMGVIAAYRNYTRIMRRIQKDD